MHPKKVPQDIHFSQVYRQVKSGITVCIQDRLLIWLQKTTCIQYTVHTWGESIFHLYTHSVNTLVNYCPLIQLQETACIQCISYVGALLHCSVVMVPAAADGCRV